MPRLQRSLLGALPVVAAVLLVAVPGSAPAAVDQGEPVAARLQYVALGDSFSSGEGLDDYDRSATCRRDSDAYPALYAARRPKVKLFFLACSGAKVDDVRAKQLGPLNATTQFVSMTIGGNDVGFSKLAKDCVVGGCGTGIKAAELRIRKLGPKLDALYAEIKRRAPKARVVVLGYPQLFGPAGCGGTRGIQVPEQRRLNGLVDLLANVTGAATIRAKVNAIDVRKEFQGHAVCEKEWIRGLSRDVDETFHPKAAGHLAYYAKLRSFAP